MDPRPFVLDRPQTCGIGYLRINKVKTPVIEPSMIPKFYSQSGEDALLAALFPQAEGYFVEVGCIDGKRFSNTYHFELRGWKGLCVEAHTDYIPLLKTNRPGSTVVHAAAGPEQKGSVTFYANRRGSLSTLDPAKEGEFREKYGQWFTGFESQSVPMKPLSKMLDEHPLPRLDFISIDVEGSELDVLRGLDFSRHRPEILVLEADNEPTLQSLVEYLLPRKYRYFGCISHNAFFSEAAFTLPKNLGDLRLSIDLTLSPHPLDSVSEQENRVQVDWRPA